MRTIQLTDEEIQVASTMLDMMNNSHPDAPFLDLRRSVARKLTDALPGFAEFKATVQIPSQTSLVRFARNFMDNKPSEN